jgi:hypothetical protein
MRHGAGGSLTPQSIRTKDNSNLNPIRRGNASGLSRSDLINLDIVALRIYLFRKAAKL